MEQELFDTPEDFLKEFPQCTISKNNEMTYQVNGFGQARGKGIRLVQRGLDSNKWRLIEINVIMS